MPTTPEAARKPVGIQRDIIPCDKDEFYRDVSVELISACKKRDKEQPLYSPINRILSKHSETVKHARPQSVRLSVQGQYPFEKDVDVETSRSKFTVNNVEFQAPAEIPDFVRVFVEDGVEDADHVLVDFVEVKPLKTDVDWNTPGAREVAQEVLKASLLQLYRQAMAGFFHHPEWTCVYGILVVGVYFSQFRWRRQKGEDVCPPIEYDFKSFPAEPISPEEHQALLDELKAAIEECSNRSMPKILCWNRPMFDFHGEGKHPKVSFSDVTLTEEFLWALRQPFKEHAKTRSRRSFLSAPGKKPWRINRDIRENNVVEIVYDILTATPLKELIELYEIETLETASTVSQKRNEMRSFGLDPDYSPPRKAKKSAGKGPAPKARRAQRKKRGEKVAAPQGSEVSVEGFAEPAADGPANM